MKRVVAFVRNEDGATAVEYAVLLALILVVVIASISSFGSATGGLWGNIDSRLQGAGF